MKMKTIKLLLLAMLLLALLALLGACGTSSSNTASPTAALVYKVEYIPRTGMNAPVQGKTVFQLKITKQSDGTAATGLSPSLNMTMHMINGMTHSTPVDSVKETGTPGTYDCTVYYLMASGPSMGTWEMKVTVGNETTTFNPDVAMAMGSDTVYATVYGPDDIVSGMSGTDYNKYYLFIDGPVSASTPTFKLYITHSEDMKMKFVTATAGSLLGAPTGTIKDMLVTMSTDSAFSSSATIATDENGHWSVSGLSLVSSVSNTIYVKMNVNTQDKTTDGKAPSGGNAYATFLVTPGM
jgi:hypothetical protein